MQLCLVDKPCLVRTDRFEQLGKADLFPIVFTGKHRAAAANDSRDIQAHRRHDHARNDLIAVRHKHKAVKAVRHRHGFDAVGNQFTAGKRIFHTDMPHSNAVAHADSRH